MTRPVSHAAVIGAIVKKDLAEYGRDRLWSFLTLLVLVVVIAMFWVLPDEVDESLTVGVAGLEGVDLTAIAEEEGLRILPFESAPDLKSVVAREAIAWRADGGVVVGGADASVPDGVEEVDVGLGIAFPGDFLTATAAGERTEVVVYVDAAVPEEIEAAVSGVVREMAFAIAGDALPVTTPAPDEVYVVLGEDRVGNQVTVREGVRPVFVFLVLLMELFVMASLIAKEIQDRTITAILVTPATVGDVLAAKRIAGASSGLVQAVVVLVAIDSLSSHPGQVLTLFLLGSVMVAGTAMLAGSAGKDFISTLFQGMVYMVPLMIPALAVLLPGTPSVWVRALPSYPLVQGLVEVGTYGAGWAETLPELGMLLAWCVGLFMLGWVVLRRKVQTT